jgi:hypothetical protein
VSLPRSIRALALASFATLRCSSSYPWACTGRRLRGRPPERALSPDPALLGRRLCPPGRPTRRPPTEARSCASDDRASPESGITYTPRATDGPHRLVVHLEIARDVSQPIDAVGNQLLETRPDSRRGRSPSACACAPRR